MHRFLLSTSFLVILTTPAALADERPLNPRIDTGLKLGTERGIVTTEIWVPVRQAPDRVLYGDARLTGDDRDNFEGNLGGGYRHIYGDTVLGAHGWIDQRKTARGSTFHQATVGVEALGRDFDARLNAYVPLSGSKTYSTPNSGREDPYLAGSGVFYDTTGQLVEEPQGGFDIELGARLPVFEQRVDSIRVYGGFYHFGGDETPDVTGWRARVSADVTPQLQLGARFQKDSERGSQGFLEATLRFPGKASFRREGLRARLDDSPERDMDIVTGAAVTDSGIGKPVLNETGNPQRVLHVDNTASGDGKGTNESPYATLKAAEAAMKPYDVIYVREGDGGTTGQDLGIVIDKPNVSLIGSGVDLVYEGGRVTGAAAGTTTGTVLAAATAAPVITNTQASGDGVLVTADAALITGMTVSGAQRYGVFAYATGGQALDAFSLREVTASANDVDGVRVESRGAGSSWGAVDVENVSATANVGRGVFVYAFNGGTIGTASLDRITSQNNTSILGRGVEIRAEGAGSVITQADASDITAQGNASHGVFTYALSGGQIGTVGLNDIAAASNSLEGVYVLAQSSQIGVTNVRNVAATSNGSDGVFIQATGAGAAIATANVSDVSAIANAARGVFAYAFNGGTIGTASLDRITSQNNTSGLGRGVEVRSEGAGSVITDVHASAITATGNSAQGVLVYAPSSGQIGSAELDNITATGNGQQGILIQTMNGGILSAAQLNDITASANITSGLRIEANGVGATIALLTASNVIAQNHAGASGYGILIVTQNSGQLDSASLSNILTTGNAQQGVLVRGQTNSALSVSIARATIVDNTVLGIFVDDDTTGAFTVDLGGGTLGSTGGNRIYGNTGTDLLVDLDGGQLKAENNWWGNAAGLLPARVTLDVGSTVDADPFLAADPGL